MSRGESATPLGKVRGLGSAGHGGSHWLEERFTSISLVFLSLWLIFSLIKRTFCSGQSIGIGPVATTLRTAPSVAITRMTTRRR